MRPDVWEPDQFNNPPMTEVFHRNGVPWYRAPKPPKDHECQAQSYGWVSYVYYVARCACGARRTYENEPWYDRNNS